MSSQNRRQFLQTSLAAAGAFTLAPALGSGMAWGKEPVAGIETVVVPIISGEEFTRQPGMWLTLEVRFKPVRLITVDLPDPRNPSKTTRQLVWYLVYRAINRAGDTEYKPTNVTDEKATFVPEFLLVTENGGKQKRYFDRVIPVAQAAIDRRERHDYSSVELLGELPAVTPVGAKKFTSLDGVAIWRGVDPVADRYKVYMTGFSNGYRVGKLPNGEEFVERKTIVQEFWRPGDALDQFEGEIRPVGDPQWIYR